MLTTSNSCHRTNNKAEIRFSGPQCTNSLVHSAFSGLFQDLTLGQGHLSFTVFIAFICMPYENKNAVKVHSPFSFPVWNQKVLIPVVTSSPVGPLQICFWPESHVPKQCDYSGDWLLASSGGRGSKTFSQNASPPTPLTFPSCQNSQ